jgi:hypothetical protein
MLELGFKTFFMQCYTIPDINFMQFRGELNFAEYDQKFVNQLNCCNKMKNIVF